MNTMSSGSHEKTGAGRYLKYITLYSLTGMMLAVALILVVSFVFGSIDKSEKVYGVFVTLCYIIAAFLSGYRCMRKIAKGALLIGGSAGLALSLMITLVAFAVNREMIGFKSLLVNLLILIVSSIVGAMAAAGKKGGKRSSRKRK